MPIAEYIKSVKPQGVIPADLCEKDILLAMTISELWLESRGSHIEIQAPMGLGLIPKAVLMAAVCGHPVDRKWIGKAF